MSGNSFVILKARMAYDPERITYFAKTDARGKNTPFGIKAKDRTRHVYVIGKTGMGKSTLLENMAVQDIKNGEGMAFIDPHGQTAETLLDYIPEERKKDVLYFAPFDMGHPISFNVMEDVGADKRHLVVSGLMSTFKKIWVDAWSARMEYILSNTLLALLEYPGSTLLGVNRMLSDKVYRKKVIDNITDPAVKSFWVDEFLKYNERYMQEAGDAIKNKIGQFTANPLIRNIIGQPKSSFDVREMMDNKQILIMNLSKGLIGETNANLLGSMLITRVYLSAMSRAELSPNQMNEMSNFYFYVDEFQSFANEAFANILSEARKYKLNLTIAHQYIEQMEEEVRNAVFGNVGTTISFRVGPFDAEVLETVFAPKFYATDIVNLGFAQVYLTLMIDGIGSQPFSAVTLPPIQPEHESCKDMVIHESRQRYSKTREEVEDAITLWHGNEEPKDKQPGKSKHTDQPTTRQKREDSPANKPKENGYKKSPTHSKAHKKDDRIVPSNQGKNNEKSLDELRAVLSSMTAGKNQNKEKTTDEEKNPQMNSQANTATDKVEPSKKSRKENGEADKVSLKDALNGALKARKPAQVVSRDNEQVPIKSDENQNKQPRPKQKTTKPAPVSDEKNRSDKELGKEGNRVDPKKIERMMRITTSDKPPLR